MSLKFVFADCSCTCINAIFKVLYIDLRFTTMIFWLPRHPSSRKNRLWLVLPWGGISHQNPCLAASLKGRIEIWKYRMNLIASDATRLRLYGSLLTIFAFHSPFWISNKKRICINDCNIYYCIYWSNNPTLMTTKYIFIDIAVIKRVLWISNS